MRESFSALMLTVELSWCCCCASSTIDRRHMPDGSWQLTCRLPLDECARQADILCMNQRYRVLRGRSEHVLRGAGPSRVEYRTSEFAFVCSEGDEDRSPSDATAAATIASTPSSPAVDPSRPANRVQGIPLCIPGATQTCVGPGACSGGQACRVDGSGFGPCDCGPKAVGDDAGPIHAGSGDASS